MFDDFYTQYQADDFEEDIDEEEKMEIYKEMFRKKGNELEQYLNFKKRGSVVKAKKGKGSFKRKPKYGYGD